MAALTKKAKNLIERKKQLKQGLADLQSLMDRCTEQIDKDLFASGIEVQKKLLKVVEFELRDAKLYEYLDEPEDEIEKELLKTEALDYYIKEGRKKNVSIKKVNERVKKFVKENDIAVMEIQQKQLVLYFKGIKLGYLTQDGDKYLYKADYLNTKEAIKQWPLCIHLHSLIKRGKKLYDNIPEPFSGYLPCTHRSDIVKQAGIEKSDSDFERLYKVAQLKFNDDFEIKRQ